MGGDEIYVVVNAAQESEVRLQLECHEGAYFNSMEEAEKVAKSWRSFGPVYIYKCVATHRYPARANSGTN